MICWAKKQTNDQLNAKEKKKKTWQVGKHTQITSSTPSMCVGIMVATGSFSLKILLMFYNEREESHWAQLKIFEETQGVLLFWLMT